MLRWGALGHDPALSLTSRASPLGPGSRYLQIRLRCVSSNFREAMRDHQPGCASPSTSVVFPPMPDSDMFCPYLTFSAFFSPFSVSTEPPVRSAELATASRRCKRYCQLSVECGLTPELTFFFLGGLRDSLDGFVSATRLAITIGECPVPVLDLLGGLASWDRFHSIRRHLCTAMFACV
jgi:hypothetical protein